jgi:hypothetical protein
MVDVTVAVSSRSLRAALLSAIVLAAAGPAAGVTASGLHGVVRRGPTSPVCFVGQPCSAPVKTTLVFNRLGRRVLVRSGADGAYLALLAPGIYAVTTSPRIGFGVVKPARVEVRAGHLDRLDFLADTGIR